MIPATTNSFAYNGLGLRVSKNNSAGAFAYVCDGTDAASAVLKDGKATFTSGLSERRRTVSKFTHKDVLGSTRGITDTTQTVTDSLLFDAFGMTVSRTGTTPTPFGFVGGAQYQTDNDSGLMLLGHRYYDSSIGRFISSDPVHDGDNWYVYCENDPLNSIDANGLEAEEVLGPIRRGIAKGKLDAGTAEKYRTDKDWKQRIHLKITQLATYPSIERAKSVKNTFNSNPLVVTAWMCLAKCVFKSLKVDSTRFLIT